MNCLTVAGRLIAVAPPRHPNTVLVFTAMSSQAWTKGCSNRMKLLEQSVAPGTHRTAVQSLVAAVGYNSGGTIHMCVKSWWNCV